MFLDHLSCFVGTCVVTEHFNFLIPDGCAQVHQEDLCYPMIYFMKMTVEVVAIDEHFICHLIHDHTNCSLTTAKGSQHIDCGSAHICDTFCVLSYYVRL